ncbi:polysaccharide biosynthesis tyrosine autokinase [Corynebacterium pacaense]|uniref:polysaccharide biosynthesis tyrosine autokinase n=1 Tax=Corynebacterium pacaense TaxID=1816684 RepID=UPI0009BB3235|nr:polysaccharide biosynthesis tyrosine autokinase [Corynebacterium pacaense]
MELSDYLGILRRYWALIMTMTILGFSAGAAYCLIVTPKYVSQTQVYVSVRSGTGTTDDLVQGAAFAREIIGSFVQVVGTAAVLDPVIEELGLDMSAEDLAKRVKASSTTESVLINISASSPSAEQSALIAGAVGESFKEVVRTQLEPEGAAGDSSLSLTTTQPARVPKNPTTPNLVNSLALGLFAGFVLGYAVAILRNLLDNKIHTVQDIEKITEKPVLGRIADSSNAEKNPLLLNEQLRSPRAEAYRTLRTNLEFLSINSGNRVFVVTSPNPNEGKTTTSLNLAITLAQAGSSVAVVEGDLRKPGISGYLGVEGGAGLTDVLIGSAKLDDVLQRWGRSELYVLPAGQIPPNPSELLGSPQMESALATLEQRFDYVIIDAPPALAVTDAAVVGKRATGILVVAAAQSTARQDLESTLQTLCTAGAAVLGIILTMVPEKGPGSIKYYGYGKQSPTESTAAATPGAEITDDRVSEHKERHGKQSRPL